MTKKDSVLPIYLDVKFPYFALPFPSLACGAPCLHNALGSAVALAPVVLFFLVSGVLRAWPHVQLGAGEAWGTLRGFAARNPAAERCFLLPR